MNSVFSKSNKNPDPKAIQKFADDVGGLINRSGSLSEWAKKIVIRNVAFIESSEVDPALSYYVAGTQWFAEANVDWSRVHDWAPVSKLDAFLEMCDFLKIGKIGD